MNFRWNSFPATENIFLLTALGDWRKVTWYFSIGIARKLYLRIFHGFRNNTIAELKVSINCNPPYLFYFLLPYVRHTIVVVFSQ